MLDPIHYFSQPTQVAAMTGKRKKKRKKVRYRRIVIKLSPRQQRSLVNYCKARQTTPNKLIKKMIKPFLNGYDKDVPQDILPAPNQLDLFKED